MADVEELQRRLAAAETVCVLVGWTAADGTSEEGRALTQAWIDWHHAYPDGLPEPQSQEWAARIQDLANRRSATRTLTLNRLMEGGSDGQ